MLSKMFISDIEEAKVNSANDQNMSWLNRSNCETFEKELKEATSSIMTEINLTIKHHFSRS